jgi:cytochrome c2
MRVAAAALCLLVILLAGCGSHEAQLPRIAGASQERGLLALRRFDCGVCHQIPGLRGARGQVGPPLHRYARRVYVAGKFPNDAEHLIRWLQDPPAMAPHTAMPRLGVSEQEATDMAAYLLALR